PNPPATWNWAAAVGSGRVTLIRRAHHPPDRGNPGTPGAHQCPAGSAARSGANHSPATASSAVFQSPPKAGSYQVKRAGTWDLPRDILSRIAEKGTRDAAILFTLSRDAWRAQFGGLQPPNFCSFSERLSRVRKGT